MACPRGTFVRTLTFTLLICARAFLTTSDALASTLAAPKALLATVKSATRIDLAWTDTTTDETGFRIERRLGTSGAYSLLATIPRNATAFSDASLAPATTYSYRVLAFNAVGTSAAAEASATTSAAPPKAPEPTPAVVESPLPPPPAVEVPQEPVSSPEAESYAYSDEISAQTSSPVEPAAPPPQPSPEDTISDVTQAEEQSSDPVTVSSPTQTLAFAPPSAPAPLPSQPAVQSPPAPVTAAAAPASDAVQSASVSGMQVQAPAEAAPAATVSETVESQSFISLVVETLGDLIASVNSNEGNGGSSLNDRVGFNGAPGGGAPGATGSQVGDPHTPVGNVLGNDDVLAPAPVFGTEMPSGPATLVTPPAAPPGQLDTTFGVNGTRTHSFSNGTSPRGTPLMSVFAPRGIAQQPDGSFVAAGTTCFQSEVYDSYDKTYYINCSSQRFSMVRFLADGTVDPAFGLRSFHVAGWTRSDGYAVQFQSDGKIVALGTSYSTVTIAGVTRQVTRLTLIRVGPDGTPDTSFGQSGIVTGARSSIAVNLNPDNFSLAIQSDGKLVASGPFTDATDFSQTFPPAHFAISRFTPSGAPDTSFGGDGIINTPVVANQLNGIASALKIQTIGSTEYILAAGGVMVQLPGASTKQAYAVLARFLPDGSLDSSFATGGVTTKLTDNPAYTSPTIAIPSQLGMQPDGKILAAWRTNDHSGAPPNFVLCRFSANGALDPSFGAGGIANAPTPGTFGTYKGTYSLMEVTNSIAVQSDGKILMLGSYYYPHAPNNLWKLDHAVYRYTAAGALDTSFGTGGVSAINATPTASNYTVGMAIQPGGTIILVDYATSGSVTRLIRISQ